jgi:ABC-2 type transport system ATP-binding protein
VLHRDGIGGLSSLTVAGLSESERRDANDAGLELSRVSLQQLIIQLPRTETKEFEASA